MSKKVKYCWDCDTEFSVKSFTTLSSDSKMDVNYCPFCGSEIADEDEVLEDDSD